MKMLAYSACVLCLLTATGCLTPYARYTRPSRQAAAPSPAGELKVPRDWDYRRHYRIPDQRLKSIIDKHLGTPYRYGGMDRRGMDCSGFVIVVFRELNRARLPRSSRAMSRLGRPVRREAGRSGDLVFFRGGFFNRVNHVGIYMGDGKFAHASRKKGVTYSSLDQDYYRKTFAGMRRIF
jgi:probable lipoprotein NlpC